MKCDLHVHTLHSGMCTVPLLDRICRESYNDPHQVYETLKLRGMDLVTVTDHDSIDAVEPLRRHRDFFLSEEVSCRTSSGTHLHMGVYGIEERHHAELQRRSEDMAALLAYLDEQGLLFSVNHVFSGLTGKRTEADFDEFASRFPAVETLNGQMLDCANRRAAGFAARSNKIAMAGSDAHTLACLGRTYTEVPGARDANRVPRRLAARPKSGRGRIRRLLEADARHLGDWPRPDARASRGGSVGAVSRVNSRHHAGEFRAGILVRAQVGTADRALLDARSPFQPGTGLGSPFTARLFFLVVR